MINEQIEQIINNQIDSFCKKWSVTNVDMHYHSRFYSKNTGLVISDMGKFCSYDNYKSQGGELSKIKYFSSVRKEAEKLIVEEILPLRER